MLHQGGGEDPDRAQLKGLLCCALVVDHGRGNSAGWTPRAPEQDGGKTTP